MKNILITLFIVFCSHLSSFAQNKMALDGGKSEKSVSRLTKKIGDVRINSARVIIETKMQLDYSCKEGSIARENIFKGRAMNGLNIDTIVFYLTEPLTKITLNVSSAEYSDFALEPLELKAKETYRYYIFDPDQERLSTRIIRQKQESRNLRNGEKLLSEKSYDAAKAEFQKAIALNVMCDSAYYGIGRVYIEQNSAKEAFDNFILALNINSEFDEIYNIIRELSLYESATTSMDRLFSYDEYKIIDPNFRHNYILLGAITRDRNRSVICYQKAISEDPDCMEAYYMMGYSLLPLRRSEEAIAAFKTIIERSDLYSARISKQLSDLFRNKTNVVEQRSSLEKGIELFDWILAKHPENYDYNYHKARLCHSRGIDYFSKIQAKEDMLRMAIKHYDKALQRMDKQASNSTQIYQSCYFGLGVCYEELEDNKSAKKYYQMAVNKGDKESERRLNALR